MPVFLKYGSITGDSKSTGHETWIELDSFSWGITRGIGSGPEADREGTTPSVGEITVTKATDAASQDIVRAALAGGPAGGGTDVQIDFATANPSGPFTYLTYKMTNTLISGYSLSSGGDIPHESLSLNFTKIEVTFNPMNPDNTPGSPNTLSYDLGAHALS